MDATIILSDVWKAFGRVQAVRGLSLIVPAGSIYGFLGPNGAGKSTTLRMILGLLRQDKGSIELFGESLGPGRMDALRKVGSLVEAPSLYLHLTGRENLEIHRLLLNVRRHAIDEALDIVDLTRAAEHLVRGYSSGMKQRLGIAQALLGKPEVLLLDEPTNALDPAGIHEMRNLIRDLPSRSSTTVFLSSHLLSEVEQVATHVAIVAKGLLKFQGTTAEVGAQRAPTICLEVDRTDIAVGVLRRAGLSVSLQGDLLRATDSQLSAADVNRMLVHAGLSVSSLTTEYPTLEDTFLRMTSSQSETVGGSDVLASTSQ